MGHVQSGKTTNYIGLICKAADAGYKVIIVIAGIHNSLRNQTQRRIDEGFIGFDSASVLGTPGNQLTVGVGKIDSKHRPNTFTTSFQDFNAPTARAVRVPLKNLRHPVVFVIKKNVATLRNLLLWLTEQNAKNHNTALEAPMLLIDDEADNASINIGGGQEADEVSKINSQIRQLLEQFDRRNYVGYTATPFANIFIDPDSGNDMYGQDLFPRDFVFSLDAPDNYFGPSRVFTDEPDHILRPIRDSNSFLPVKHKINQEVSGVSNSLKEAVRTFVVAKAIRLSRRQLHEHNSMLINASRFVDVQRQLRHTVASFLEEVKSSVSVHSGLVKDKALKDAEMQALRSIFQEEYGHLDDVKWSDVQGNLWSAISEIAVLLINSKSSDCLDYSEYRSSGRSVIVIGGFSLSRGLTLKGLVVSYFLRSSMIYDTIMQMGRWFGFRIGYDDLCRIWMTDEARGWYSHISNAVEELREDVHRMMQANATPMQFGLKVRSHPSTLVVTARNKMGRSRPIKVQVGLSDRFIETFLLRRDPESLEANRVAAKQFALVTGIATQGYDSKWRGHSGRFVSGIPVSAVFAFIASFRAHDQALMSDGGPVLDYIGRRKNAELKKWDVLFASIRRPTAKTLMFGEFGYDLACQRRRLGQRSGDQALWVSDRQRVAARGVECVGLSRQQMEAVERKYRKQRNLRGRRVINYPDRIYRAVRNKPLLVVHMLAIGNRDQDLSQSNPVVAWSISFPKSDDQEETVEYIVNTTWFRERYKEEEYEEEVRGDA